MAFKGEQQENVLNELINGATLANLTCHPAVA